MIYVSDSAKEKFVEFMSTEEKKDAYVRIYVSGVGWGGPRYGLTLDESVQEGKDIVEDTGAFKVIFDRGIANFVDGKSIDYHDGPHGGFSITDQKPIEKQCQCDGGCC
jgi:iron-sulfur cluster assembly accessory protein